IPSPGAFAVGGQWHRACPSFAEETNYGPARNDSPVALGGRLSDRVHSGGVAAPPAAHVGANATSPRRWRGKERAPGGRREKNNSGCTTHSVREAGARHSAEDRGKNYDPR